MKNIVLVCVPSTLNMTRLTGWVNTTYKIPKQIPITDVVFNVGKEYSAIAERMGIDHKARDRDAVDPCIKPLLDLITSYILVKSDRPAIIMAKPLFLKALVPAMSDFSNDVSIVVLDPNTPRDYAREASRRDTPWKSQVPHICNQIEHWTRNEQPYQVVVPDTNNPNYEYRGWKNSAMADAIAK